MNPHPANGNRPRNTLGESPLPHRPPTIRPWTTRLHTPSRTRLLSETMTRVAPTPANLTTHLAPTRAVTHPRPSQLSISTPSRAPSASGCAYPSIGPFSH